LHQQSHEPARSAPTYVPVQPLDESARHKRDNSKKEADPTAQQSAPAPTTAAAAPPPPPAVSAPSEPFSSADKSAAATSADAEAKGNLAGSAAREQESRLSEDAANASLAAKPARSTTGPAPTSSAELHRDMQLAPEDWLTHIQQLLRQGRRQQAIESLQLFRRAHPDWQLSDELRALSE